MAIVEEQEMESVNANGALVVRLPGDESAPEVYELTKIPSATMSLVREAKKEIVVDLDLRSVITDLNRASDLLYLAYLGVIGTGELQANVSRRQKELSDLCGDCMLTMRALKEGSHAVLLNLTEAYKYLLLAKERRALTVLGRCASAASSMSTQCGSLATRFGVLKEDTAKDAHDATIASGEHIQKVKELESHRRDWEANKADQEATTKELNDRIEGLTTDIAKEEKRADEAEERAFYGRLAGAFFGAVGAGLGVAANPLGSMIRKTGASVLSVSGGSGGSGDSNPSPDLEQKKDEKASAEEALKNSKMAETQAKSKKSKAESQVFDAKALTASKQTLLQQAQDARPVDEQKVKQAQMELDTSINTLTKLEADKEEAEEALKQASKQASKSKRDAEDLLKGVSAALQHIEKTLDRLSDADSARAQDMNSKILSMVEQKQKLETLRLESIGKLAEMTSRLQSSTEEIGVENSAKDALQIATWALDNIFAALSNAKLFWDSMTKFCKNLAESKLAKEISDELEFDTPEERVTVYKSQEFVKLAVSYLARWAALTDVCADYIQGSSDARLAVLEHIKASPNAKEASELLPVLKKKLEDELNLDAANSNTNLQNLKEKAKQLKDAFSSE